MQFRDIFISNVCLNPDPKPGFISLALGPECRGGRDENKSPMKAAKRKSEDLASKRAPAKVSQKSTAILHKHGSGLGSLKIQLLICPNSQKY